VTELDKKVIGNRIRELREGLEMSQPMLAEKVGVARNTVSQYESGTCKMSIDVLVRLAVALDISTDYLLGLKKYPE